MPVAQNIGFFLPPQQVNPVAVAVAVHDIPPRGVRALDLTRRGHFRTSFPAHSVNQRVRPDAARDIDASGGGRAPR